MQVKTQTKKNKQIHLIRILWSHFKKICKQKNQVELKGGALVQKSINNASNFCTKP